MAAGETATTIVRERGLANAVSWPRRVVFAWWLVLAALTAVLFADPDLDVSFRHDALSFTLETFNALVASMVAFVGIARYVFRRQPFDLAVAGAFGVIAVNSLWFGLILPFSGFTPRDLGDAPIYGWIVTRAVAGVLLLLGLRGGQRSWRLVEASSWVLGLVLSIALIDVGLWRWHGALPHLLQPRAWEILSRRSDFDTAILPGQTMLGIALELGLAALYLVLAMWLSVAVERGADAWLALSVITAGVAELQFVFYPLPFHPAITTADLLWLISYLLLLAYLGHQYLQLATGMRRQQERAAALLALSQTTVASRDPRLVVAAAREAVRAVPAGVAVDVVLDRLGPAPSAPSRGQLMHVYPIEADGIRYGALIARISPGHTLWHGTDEYLRIVANQMASLLRAIDLYDELAESAVQEERAQLARELHDGLAQDLAVLRLRLGKRGDAVAQLAERALSEARYAITILRGQTAAPVHFLQALERQVEDLSDRFGCPVTIEQVTPLRDLPAQVQVALLRIVREAVTNAGKHGSPSRVVVQLAQRDGTIEATVVDDGRGFDPAVPPPPDRFGLRGMAERAAALDGALTIESAPGRGTTVRVRLPGPAPVAEGAAR